MLFEKVEGGNVWLFIYSILRLYVCLYTFLYIKLVIELMVVDVACFSVFQQFPKDSLPSFSPLNFFYVFRQRNEFEIKYSVRD